MFPHEVCRKRRFMCESDVYTLGVFPFLSRDLINDPALGGNLVVAKSPERVLNQVSKLGVCD
jgi:hypothetical protein